MTNEISNLGERSRQWHQKFLSPFPENEEGLAVRDHRSMVGGNWEKLGKLQFDFMVSEVGLKPENTLLDLACGSFRAGRLFIPYLNAGNYLGMDKQAVLIEEGKKKEIPPSVWEEHCPEIVVSGKFEFDKLSKSPEFVIAQSLFTHLTKSDIILCLNNLRQHCKPNVVLYASFCETNKKIMTSLPSHSSRDFFYTVDEMRTLAENTDWKMEYIGDWKHPHPDTKMLKYSVA